MKNLRTAVIGVGAMGQHHARIYSEFINLIAVVDMNEKVGSSIARKFSTDYFSDYRSILDKVDAVTIAVPTNAHYEVAKDFIESKVNVLVEKPLAQDSLTASKIIDLAEKHNVVLSVGHIERHNEVIKYAKNQLLAGHWGEIRHISARRFSLFPARITDVGVIFDIGIHDIDILSHIAGHNPISVSATGKSQSKEFEDHAILSLEFNDNCTGICETSWLSLVKFAS